MGTLVAHVGHFGRQKSEKRVPKSGLKKYKFSRPEVSSGQFVPEAVAPLKLENFRISSILETRDCLGHAMGACGTVADKA